MILIYVICSLLSVTAVHPLQVLLYASRYFVTVLHMFTVQLKFVLLCFVYCDKIFVFVTNTSYTV